MDLKHLPVEQVKAVFTDLDDTLTDESKILPETYEALWELRRKNYWIVVVSGRPAGWADCLMRLWPLDAMIFENGAGIITRDGSKLLVHNLAPTENASEQRKLLEKIFRDIRKRIPKAKLASDQPYRLFDYAIDFNEEPPKLSQKEVVLALEQLAKHKEITAKLSSIHINYWVGRHTKVTCCEWLLEREGVRRNTAKENVVFCGDSPNDEPLFGAFTLTVGVANIEKYLKEMRFQPKYLATQTGGAGFRELVEKLPHRKK